MTLPLGTVGPSAPDVHNTLALILPCTKCRWHMPPLSPASQQAEYRGEHKSALEVLVETGIVQCLSSCPLSPVIRPAKKH